jgi:glycosyltransferase involved in cell wall biosynthesis
MGGQQMNINFVPVISVVIPMYNVEKYIAQSIRSVLNQSYHHFELLLVDDGCSDNTTTIIEQFDDNRIRLIHQKNLGLSAARNTGIDASRGLYVALLDADDYWATNKLARHVHHFNNNPEVGVSYCSSLFVDEHNKLLNIGRFPRLEKISKQHVFCQNPVGSCSTPVIRCSLLEEISYFGKGKDKYRKMYFNESLKKAPDIELWVRIAVSSSWLFEGIDEPMTFTRIHSNGLRSSLDQQFAYWHHAVSFIKEKDLLFFNKNYGLAKAYQLRYLASKAAQTKNKLDGLRFIHKAVYCDFRIIFQEPRKTFMTFFCACLQLLPDGIYRRIEHLAMEHLANKRMSLEKQD